MEHKLPPHPEHTMQWSPREQRVLVGHFEKAIDPLQKRIAELEAQIASGQEPVAWMVFWGLGKKRPGALFLDREHAVSHAKQIKSETEVRPVYTHPAPAQQPIANRKEPDMQAICAALGFDPTNHHNAAKCPYCRPAAPAQQPLGIEEIQKLAADNATGGFLGPLTFARAIEAKHGIKGKP